MGRDRTSAKNHRSRGLACGVPAGDAAALADGIVMLLGDPVRRERMACDAAHRARTHDADWTANALEELYAEISGR
jgi:hypothetical protein